jgi:hypothetical protein
MTEFRDNFWFHVDPYQVETSVTDLGPDGIGVTQFKHAVSQDYLDQVATEISDPQNVTWRSNRTIDRNGRGVLIHQNYDAYALKLYHGDLDKLSQLPVTRGLTGAVENLIRFDIAQYFPPLVDWYADEMAIHRYDAGAVGITPHRDQKRFWGMIAVATLDGEGEFTVCTDTDEVSLHAQQGDIILMRGTGLYEADGDIRPLHGVAGDRTSLVIRANKQPDEQKQGFVYDNWPTDG